ncbi:cold response protein 1 [Penicillium pulvis]|uniref:cold response protein 1 n=1 Tax=Penicillium pulvis TaxID=1562058 RepID=UPI00254674E2|nr:cold response protein 1 [Penicillium pulvis]KAJ5786188.1 cold response protein 1 [Penicillium pulvis]
MSERQSGVDQWLSEEKGYGFITPDSGPDLFVHFRSIEGSGFRQRGTGGHFWSSHGGENSPGG